MTHWVKWDHVMIVWSEYNAREVRINTGWWRVAQTGWRSAGCLLSQLCSRSGVYCALLSNVRDQLIGGRSVSCCHDNSTVMTTHTQLLCTMCDDTMTCDYMTIVSRVTVIFTLSWSAAVSRGMSLTSILWQWRQILRAEHWASLLLLCKQNNPGWWISNFCPAGFSWQIIMIMIYIW